MAFTITLCYPSVGNDLDTCPRDQMGRETKETNRTSRLIQRRVTSQFEFRLPSPPWMAYTFCRKTDDDPEETSSIDSTGPAHANTDDPCFGHGEPGRTDCLHGIIFCSHGTNALRENERRSSHGRIHGHRRNHDGKLGASCFCSSGHLRIPRKSTLSIDLQNRQGFACLLVDVRPTNESREQTPKEHHFIDCRALGAIGAGAGDREHVDGWSLVGQLSKHRGIRHWSPLLSSLRSALFVRWLLLRSEVAMC